MVEAIFLFYFCAMKNTSGGEIKNSLFLSHPDDFKLLFERFYSPLCNYACSLIRHDQDAEDVVQSLFIELWEKRASYILPPEPQFFLLRATKNRAIDHLRRQTKMAQTISSSEAVVEYAHDYA